LPIIGVGLSAPGAIASEYSCAYLSLGDRDACRSHKD